MSKDILDCYEQAQTFTQGIMSANVVLNDAVFPHWIGNSEIFWYIRETRNGNEYRLVNAKAASNELAFDHKAMADALTAATGQSVDVQDLPINDVAITLLPLQINFQAFAQHWFFEPEGQGLQKAENFTDESLCSPDSQKSVFVREYNLWIRDQATGEEQPLTQDGIADYSYGCAQFDPTVQALWSPDSQRLLTVRLDLREVMSRPYVHYAPKDGCLHPKLKQDKLAYPGDAHVESYRLVVIDASTGQVQAADYHTLPTMLYSMDMLGFLNGKPLGWWSLDSRDVFFIDVARGAKSVRVVKLDSQTGATQVLFEESSKTFVKLYHTMFDTPMFLALPESNELIWFSERSGWGHLYLYDLDTGELMRPITGGEQSVAGGKWVVRDVLHYDAKRREILLQTAGRDATISPYYRDICKVNIDTGELTPIISGCFEHMVYKPYDATVYFRRSFNVDSADINGVSPSGEYLVTTRSRVDTVPVSVLVDRNGHEVLMLETADVSSLPSDWQWPEPVKLKGADDQTDIYGVVFRPPGFSTVKHYPVVDFSCGQRNFSYIPQGSFTNDVYIGYFYLNAIALAALGFIVVAIGGRGEPNRDKAFQDHNYGDVSSTNDVNDRIAGLRQLAEYYPYMDLNRVGITSFDRVTNPVYAMVNHPDFYKVGVLHCFLEPRFDFAAFGETYEGISVDKATAVKSQDVVDDVESFKGKLLLVQGMLDFATPSSMFRLVDALQKANKNIDMLCLTNEIHDVPSYALRRNWDYLVEHLQGIEPPCEFQLKTSIDCLQEAAGDKFNHPFLNDLYK